MHGSPRDVRIRYLLPAVILPITQRSLGHFTRQYPQLVGANVYRRKGGSKVASFSGAVDHLGGGREG